jgi:L-erythro-3,5-diaminohexanoate dehydrogenase
MAAQGTGSETRLAGDPTGLHRVLDETGRGRVLPQAAHRLDTRRELWPDEVRVRVRTLNLDAASFRQLEQKHTRDGVPDGDAVRREVLAIIAERGKMQNPVTGSGGMLVGTVEEVGPQSALGLSVGDRVATLVSLTLTPLVIEDGLARWDGRSEQVPTDGYAEVGVAEPGGRPCRGRYADHRRGSPRGRGGAPAGGGPGRPGGRGRRARPDRPA